MDGPLVKGYCRKDFDAVKEVFFSNLKSGAEENVQLCVYVGPELVIDLWGIAEKVLHGGCDLPVSCA